MLKDTWLPSLACRRLLALAERAPRQAVALSWRAVERAQAGDPEAAAWASYTHGWALLCWERIAEAQPLLEASQASFARLAQPTAALLCRHAILLVEVWQSNRADLHCDFATIADALTESGHPLEAARARLDQARQLYVLGRPYEVDAALDRIDPHLLEQNAREQAIWLRTRGGAAALRGEHNIAAALLANAEGLLFQQRAWVELARCWSEQGRLAFLQNHLADALGFYRRAEHLYRRLDLPLRLAFCQKTIGLVLTRQGRYDDAVAATQHALVRFRALGRGGDVGGCQLNLGNVYFYTAQWDAALACYTRAEALCGADGLVLDQLIAQRNRAMVYRRQARPAAAWELLATLEERVRALGYQAELAAIANLQADLHADAQNDCAAIDRYREARDLYIELEDRTAAAVCAVELGELALRKGTTSAARAHFEDAAPVLVEHPHHRWRAAYGLAHCAALAGDDVLALERYLAASADVAALRGRLASEQASSGLFAQATQLHTDALDLAVRLDDLSALLVLTESQRALILRRHLAGNTPLLPELEQTEHERLRAHFGALLAASDPDGAALDAALLDYGDLLVRVRHSDMSANASQHAAALELTFNLAEVRGALSRMFGDDWSAVTYTISSDTLLITCVTQDELWLERVLYGSTLRELIERACAPTYRAYTYRDFPFHSRRSARPWDALRALADQLIPPTLRARLHPRHRLLIVPAGPLHQLPWAALRLKDAWLTERAVVQLVPSLTVWQALSVRQSEHARDGLLVGCSDFGSRASALPGVAAELAAVAELWAGACELLVDAQASHAAVLARLTGPSGAALGLLHLATHAQMIPTRGLAAHAKLCDGDLLLSEIVGLDLHGALVTLSACDGAAADVLEGEEVLSLSWAWLAAGAGNVLASLWPVYDQAIEALLVVFYDVLREHDDPAYALAQAQRTALRGQAGSAALEPHVWGGLVVIGRGPQK